MKPAIYWKMLVVLSLLLAAAVVVTEPAAAKDAGPMLFEADFEDGKLDAWQATDSKAWRIENARGGKVLSLFGKSNYEPKFRSPFNINLIGDVVVGSFVLELKMLSTTENYDHRDLCIFFGHQDPSHFYYVHIANRSDDVANSILVVDDKPRVSFVKTRTGGTKWDDDWHTVRLVRDVDKGTIEVFFDNRSEPIMTAVDRRFKWGRIGVGSFDDTGKFDGIKLWGQAVSAAGAEKKVFRLGMIGLDTSHVPTFTKAINEAQNNYGCKVVVGYAGGSPDVKSSATRVEKFTKQMREEFGVEIVDTIEELCEKVDGVMLESVDGRPHLEQVKPVIAAKKPVFIDKPMAGSVEDVIEIFRLAKENNVPCFSSSSLRFCPAIAEMKDNPEAGEIFGCDSYGPCHLEPHHPDLYWYGVHGVEILYTIMGPGCETVQRTQTENGELVVGVWKDGRIGTYRGSRAGGWDFGAVVHGSKGVVFAPRGRGFGYEGLVEQIIDFFRTGKSPVPAEETIEIFAFMTAADESKAKGGLPVSIKSVIEKAKR